MNIYEKLNKAKKALSVAGLKKSGKNDFAKYEYFELGDFLPTIVALEDELKFACIVSFDKELATLSIVDSEKPDSQIVFASPMSSASLKGMHDVQNLGAVQTYLRRYLYINAFEIVEQDPLDKTARKTEEPKPETTVAKNPVQNTGKITTEQYRIIQEACLDKDSKPDSDSLARLKDVLKRHGYESAKDIRPEDYEKIRTEFVDYGLPFNV
jgi:hypothetical protein